MAKMQPLARWNRKAALPARRPSEENWTEIDMNDVLSTEPRPLPVASAPTTRIKIALVYLGFYRNAGGEKRILQLIRGLDPRHYEISLITLRVNSSAIWQQLQTLPIRVVALDRPHDERLPSLRRPLTLIRTFRAITRAIRELDPQILQVQGVRVNSLARLAGWFARVPVIISVENWAFPSRPRGWRALKPWLTEHLIFALDRRSDAVIAVANAFIDHKKRKVQGTPLVKIPTPLDMRAFIGDRPTRPYAVPFEDSDRLRLGFVGRLSPEKGAHFAIEALAHVRDHYPQAELVVVGAGPQEDDLRALAAKLRLRDAVTFRGLSQDVCGELCQFDVFVMPSLTEAFGQVFLEAMAVRLPIASTRTVGSLEIFPEEMHSELVEAADAKALAAKIVELRRDPQAARAQAAALHDHGAEISCEKRFIEAHDDLYRRLFRAATSYA